VDHRTLGTFSADGADALLLGLSSWFDLVADIIMRSDEIFSLQPDALLLRWNFVGIDRAGGGALERPFIWLLVFGNDGLLARYEAFDTDRPADALARFDELTAEPSAVRRATAPARSAERHARRVRPNSATANAARTDAAIIARVAVAIADLFPDDADVLEHPTGTIFERW